MTNSNDVEIEKLFSKGTKQLETLKEIIERQEMRIKELEKRLEELEKKKN